MYSNGMMGGSYGGGFGGGLGGGFGMGNMMRSNSMVGMGGLGPRTNSYYGGGSAYGMNDPYDPYGQGNNFNGQQQPGQYAPRGAVGQRGRGRGGAAAPQRQQSAMTVTRTNVAPGSGNATTAATPGSSTEQQQSSSAKNTPAGLNQTPASSGVFDRSESTSFGTRTESTTFGVDGEERSMSQFDMDGNQAGINWSGGDGQQQQPFDPNQQQQMEGEPQMSEEEHTMQRRTFIIQSLMELSQLFSQVLNPFVQFLTLGFGSYMSISSIRQTMNNPQAMIGQGAAGEFLAGGGQQAPPVPTGGAVVPSSQAAGQGLGLKGKIALGVLTALLFILVERVYERYFGNTARRQNTTPTITQQQRRKPQSQQQQRRQLFIAKFNYTANADGQLSFKAGDRFVIEHYDSNCFVQAELLSLNNQSIDPLDAADAEKRSESGPGSEVAVGGSSVKKGLVPGNYIEPLNLRQKF